MSDGDTPIGGQINNIANDLPPADPILPATTDIFRAVSQTLQELTEFGRVGDLPEPTEIQAIDPNEEVPPEEHSEPIPVETPDHDNDDDESGGGGGDE